MAIKARVGTGPEQLGWRAPGLAFTYFEQHISMHHVGVDRRERIRFNRTKNEPSIQVCVYVSYDFYYGGARNSLLQVCRNSYFLYIYKKPHVE